MTTLSDDDDAGAVERVLLAVPDAETAAKMSDSRSANAFSTQVMRVLQR